MALKFLVPKKFFCYYPLYNGAIFVAIFMASIALITGGTILVQVLVMDSTSCDNFIWRYAFGFSVTSVIYNVVMFFLNIWLFWAIKKSKTTAMLVWVAITSVWLAQIFVLLIVLLCMYQLEVSQTAGILSLVFGIISVAGLAYFIFIVLGYWIELKNSK